MGYLKTKKKSRRYAPKKREKKTEKSTKVLKGKELLKSPPFGKPRSTQAN